jgi:hypothetical protein
MRVIAMLVVASLTGPALADDLSGAERFLCSTLRATACGTDADCESLQPADLNIPQFVQVDLPGKQLSTTPASGENRATTIQMVRREAGQIVLQGYESGRAFSLLIQEDSGRASFASAADSRGVVVFAACTPLR